MSLNSMVCGCVSRGIVLASALVMMMGCKSTPQSKPDEPVQANSCEVRDATDAYMAISQWTTLDSDAQPMSDPARALRVAWPSLHVARAWRVDATHWMALIADSPEPAPDAQVLLVSATRDARGIWRVNDPAQVTRADVLWPQL